MSRAWMKDAADAHARDCPNIKRIIKPVQPHQPLASATVRVTDDAQMRRTCMACTSSTSASSSGLQRLKGLWEKLPTKWEKRYADLDQLCNPKSNSAADVRAAALRARVGVAGV
jgi:hypothetical protein